MFFKNILNKKTIKIGVSLVCASIVYKNFTEKHASQHYAAGYNYSRRYYPASSEYPELKRNRNIMARSLTSQLYAKLRDLRTPNGFTVDDAIQTGVDNIGKFSFTGIVAGDEESYQIFRELFDKVILEKHNYRPDQTHQTDLDISKLENAEFDPEYVKSIRIKTIRNIRGYCLPPFCTRGERRDVESIVAKALMNLNSAYKGVYYSLKDLSEEEELALMNTNAWIDRPFLPYEVSANLARDWPDARGMWYNDDKSLSLYVNRNDHMLLCVTEKATNLKNSFQKLADFVKRVESEIRAERFQIMHNSHLGFITTDPKNLGTALKLTVRINLPKLSKDSRVSTVLKFLGLSQNFRIVDEDKKGDQTDSSILEIAATPTLGRSEVEVAQSFVDSIQKLIEIEKTLQNDGNLDELLY